MIFYTMLTKVLLWGTSQDSDPKYMQYLKKIETGYPPFEAQEPSQKKLLYQMLHPDASKRPEATELLQDEWVATISVCEQPTDTSTEKVYDHEHHIV